MSPYERLLGDALRGDGALFSDDATVEAAWAVVDPLLAHAAPQDYAPGSWGPEAAARVVVGNERWHDPQEPRPPC